MLLIYAAPHVYAADICTTHHTHTHTHAPTRTHTVNLSLSHPISGLEQDGQHKDGEEEGGTSFPRWALTSVGNVLGEERRVGGDAAGGVMYYLSPDAEEELKTLDFAGSFPVFCCLAVFLLDFVSLFLWIEQAHTCVRCVCGVCVVCVWCACVRFCFCSPM